MDDTVRDVLERNADVVGYRSLIYVADGIDHTDDMLSSLSICAGDVVVLEDNTNQRIDEYFDGKRQDYRECKNCFDNREEGYSFVEENWCDKHCGCKLPDDLKEIVTHNASAMVYYIWAKTSDVDTRCLISNELIIQPCVYEALIKSKILDVHNVPHTLILCKTFIEYVMKNSDYYDRSGYAARILDAI